MYHFLLKTTSQTHLILHKNNNYELSDSVQRFTCL